MNYCEYMEKTYAAWMGKMIGIRLGAPVEGWTCEEIRRTYGRVNGYLVDYGIFAADDDSNGPLFFVRALQRFCDETISEETMGNNVLNWLCDGHGFFWWGGEGIATEHTAYNNLKKGIKAPLSGSEAINGIELAEQIGGQIFSDCWGFVAPNNPELAKKLAAKMSSVTHDGDGIQGGIFVAVCIALAYGIKDIREVVEKALTYLDPKSSYVKLCKEVIEQADCHPDDSEQVLKWIQDNHGYHCYPGVCHILPNTAIMIWAMLYGKNDFDKTMNMLCEAGWDTDCTLGNVGAILGAMLGLDGIDEKWTKPINDLVLSSSCMGSCNIDTVSRSARMFCELGWKLMGKEVDEEFKLKPHVTDFILPRSTGSMRVNANRYFEANLVNCSKKLKVVVNNTYPDALSQVYLKTYYHSSEVYDSRYEPSFSPLVYPGEIIKMTVHNPNQMNSLFSLYIKDDKGRLISSKEQRIENSQDLELKLPEGQYTVMEAGLKTVSLSRQMRTYFEIERFEINPCFDYQIDFRNLKMEDWGLDFGGLHRKEVMGCVTHHGNAFTDEKGLHLNGMVTFGDTAGRIDEITVKYSCDSEGGLGVCFDVQGAIHYCAVEIKEKSIKYIRCVEGVTNVDEILLETTNIPKITLKIDRNHGLIKVVFCCTKIEFKDETLIDGTGAAALYNNTEKSCIVVGCKLASAGFQ